MVAAAFGALKKSKREESAASYEALLNGSADTRPQYMRPVQPDFKGQAIGAWNNWGQGTSGEVQVNDLFLQNSELMNDNLTSGTKHARGQNTIVNEIGGKIVGEIKLESETRLEQLDDEGGYIGSNLGQIRKSKLAEYKSRIAVRNEGKRLVSAILEEWNLLSEDEKIQRKEEADRNQAQILEQVVIIEEEEIPEEYLFSKLSLGNSDRPGQPPRSASPAVLLDDYDDDESGSWNLNPDVEESTESVQQPPRKKLATAVNARKARLRDPYVHRSPVSISIESPSHSISSTGDETPTDSTGGTPGAFNFTNHHRYHDRGYRKKRKRIIPPPPPPPAIQQWKSASDLDLMGSTSFFEVSNPKPHITPLEDIETPLFVSETAVDDLSLKVNALAFESTIQPRVVVVKLHPNVTYSSQMLLGKVHGAHLQEIQFFPEDLEALLVFIEPREAQAFVDHVEAARKRGDHEFRRLQIASAWFGGKDRMYGIYGPQKGLLELVVSEDASRAIKVSGIANDAHPQLLEAHFKAKFPQLVGLRLVRPAKNYEKQKENNTLALLDFSSIVHASAARLAFNSHTIENFEHCTADWLTDPCAKPNEPATWCRCLHCINNIPSAQVPGSNFGALHGRHAEHLGIARMDIDYDVENDLVLPSEFIRDQDPGPRPMKRDLSSR